ncbi:MAG: hypothetical protein MUC57_05205 [Desulfobacterales bacterium]|nr:hypothetical protein [Desulfobacterales bacterium]
MQEKDADQKVGAPKMHVANELTEGTSTAATPPRPKVSVNRSVFSVTRRGRMWKTNVLKIQNGVSGSSRRERDVKKSYTLLIVLIMAALFFTTLLGELRRTLAVSNPYLWDS